MFLSILKKDLQRKRAMNAILIVFIILSAMFLAASAANLMSTDKTVSHYINISKTADQYYLVSEPFSKRIADFLTSGGLANGFEENVFIYPIPDDALSNGQKIESGGHFFCLTTPDNSYNLLFDENQRQITQVNPGELALSKEVADALKLKTGDIITLTVGNVKKDFKLTTLAYDCLTGKSSMSFDRFLINRQDYDALSVIPNTIKMSMFSVLSRDPEALRTAFNKLNIPVQVEFGKADVSAMFYMERITSFIVAIVAFVLIIISLVLLRFTIKFTIEDDFREIGVMKAIGIKNSGVRSLYIFKYLVAAVLGSAVGLALSFPFGKMLIAPLKENTIMPDLSSEILLCAICAIAIILIVLLFSWLSTRQVTKMSAIQAIREGASGERFRRKGLFKLKGSGVKTSWFMAVNDVFSGLRGFVSVFLAMCLGVLMIILPANAASTLKSDGIIQYFGVSVADAYLNVTANAQARPGATYDELNSELRRIESEFAKAGLPMSADVTIQVSPRIYVNDKYTAFSTAGSKRVSDKPIELPYISGGAPLLENEVAITDVVAKRLNVTIGDKIHLLFGAKDKEYIITGECQSMNNGGNMIVFARDDMPDLDQASGSFTIGVEFTSRDDIASQIAKARETMTDYTVKTAKEAIDRTLGTAIVTMDTVVKFLVLLSLLIICLVSFLISHTLLQRDKANIALLKSIGFKRRGIRHWQFLRIMLVSVTAVLAGIALSFAINPAVTKLTFGMMGADKIPPSYDVLWTFIVYPLIMLICVAFTSIISSAGIRRIDMRNITTE
ncbi:ABC transporter permease [Clostridia bacterium]|nr:ABC transporter permease [Clostridia bacterium]